MGGDMASRKRAASKGRAATIPPRQESSVPPSHPGSSLNVRLVLVALVVAACLYAVFRAFQGSEKPKDFKVQEISAFTGEDKACGGFSAWGIAPIGKDKVVLADTNHSRLLVFDRQGKFIRQWGGLGKGPLKFHEPSGMTSGNKGDAYVMDAWNGAVKGFDENGKEVLDLELGDNSGFYGPRGIAFDGQNFVIADTGSHRVVIISPKDNIVAAFGKMGKGSGEFNGPLDVAADGKGNYYVADSGNNRMQWLNAEGKVLKTFNYDGSVPAVAVDKEGRIYVAISSNDSRVRVYDSKGGYLGDLKDQNGSGAAFGDVHSMNISGDDVLMISGGSRVSMFQLPAGNNPAN